jgi:hypothetical protein
MFTKLLNFIRNLFPDSCNPSLEDDIQNVVESFTDPIPPTPRPSNRVRD